MLIAFHSSPYSAPLQSGIPNRGFELDVDVLFVDSDSHDFISTIGKCEFHINASSPGELNLYINCVVGVCMELIRNLLRETCEIISS
jgi:hypothetical protein